MSLSDISAVMEQRIKEQPSPEGTAMWKMIKEVIDQEEFKNFAEERLMNYAGGNAQLFSGSVVPDSNDLRLMIMMGTIAAEFFYVGVKHAEETQRPQPPA